MLSVSSRFKIIKTFPTVLFLVRFTRGEESEDSTDFDLARRALD